LISFLHVADYV